MLLVEGLLELARLQIEDEDHALVPADDAELAIGRDGELTDGRCYDEIAVLQRAESLRVLAYVNDLQSIICGCSDHLAGVRGVLQACDLAAMMVLDALDLSHLGERPDLNLARLVPGRIVGVVLVYIEGPTGGCEC